MSVNLNKVGNRICYVSVTLSRVDNREYIYSLGWN